MRKIPNCVSLFLSVVLMIALMSNCSHGQNSGSLSAKSFAEKIKELPSATIVDVRTHEEYRGGHLQNALNIDWNGNDFENKITTLDKSKPVLVYCLSGGRSSSAAHKMRKEGFVEVYEMAGGMMAWRAENFAEIKIAVGTKGMTMQQYQTLISGDKLVLIDFYADWCAPCKKMKPFLEKIASDLNAQVEIRRINVDKNTELCKTLKVVALPVLKLYKKQTIVWENVGFVDESELRKIIQEKNK